MIFNIIVKEDREDKFSIDESHNNKVVSIFSYKDYNINDEKFVNHSILYQLKRNNLNPSENAIDFINLSLAIYVFDQLVTRGEHGYFKWNRYFKIHLPVWDIDKWDQAKQDIEAFLTFLSGDKWDIHFRKRQKIYKDYERKDNDIEKVCLLSGGLDSFIGATDILDQGCRNIAFVSHHKMGNSGEKSIQECLIKLFKEEFPDYSITPNYFYVQAIASNDNLLNKERSQRARSIIFIALALSVANSYSNDIPIIIPENGLISLNVPLTLTRSGSHSTKTTHPYYIDSVNKLFKHLGINNQLDNPYKHYTKGEMIFKSKKIEFIKEHAYKTISCSKAGLYVQRFHRTEKHCGHCTPCIIRRAALKKANIDSASGNYVRDVLNDHFPSRDISSRDIVAFKIALSRISGNKKSPIFNLLKSGPIPADDKDLKEYIEVYKRGMTEVKDFLFNDK